MAHTVRYLDIGRTRLAVGEIGTGSPAVLVVPGVLSHVDALWEDPAYARWMATLAETRRIVTYDPLGLGASTRGQPGGLTDPVAELETVIRSCEDDVVLFGWLSGCGIVAGVDHGDVLDRILYAPYESPPTLALDGWGSGAPASVLFPSHPEPARLARLERATASPAAVPLVARRLELGTVDTSAFDRCVALVPTRSTVAPPSEDVPQVFIDTADAMPWGDAATDVIRHLSAAAGERTNPPVRRRALVAVVVSDIVGSTGHATAVGGAEWKHRLETHDAVVVARVRAHDGAVGRHTGDGAVATFPLASPALQCAAEVAEEARRVGLPARVGVHVGEVDFSGDGPQGVTVRIATRVAAVGDAGEVVVSGTLRNVLAGSHLVVEPRGEVTLDGLAAVEVFSVVQEARRR